MKALLFGFIFLNIAPQAWAFSWQDLWHTQNHQALDLMNAGEFAKAQATFDDPAWKAAAAFRAGNYKEASILDETLKNQPDAYYNQGNALAHMGKLEPALKAYDKTLAIEPNHQDALYNRKIIETLLQKEKQQQQDKQKQDKQKQDKQEQDKQEQDKQEQDKQEQDKQEQDKQEQDKQEQDKQEQDKQEQDKQEQDKQEQDKQEQDKQEQDKQEQDKQEQDKKNLSQSQEQREKQQAKEQWLRLIPDDPGGLMREKFLRDYLRRHQER